MPASTESCSEQVLMIYHHHHHQSGAGAVGAASVESSAAAVAFFLVHLERFQRKKERKKNRNGFCTQPIKHGFQILNPTCYTLHDRRDPDETDCMKNKTK